MEQVNQVAATDDKNTQRAGWKVFLTPSWIAIAILVLMFTYFAFSFLAPWQLGKGERKSETNHRLQAALEHDPVPAGEVLPDEGPVDTDKEWTHVSLQGQFEPAKEVLLHNRPVDSNPAFQLLTPFKTTDGLTVLVNRGWVPPAEGVKPVDIPAPPSGQLTVTGFVRLGEGSTSDVVNADGVPQTQVINTSTIGKAQGIELAHDYVQLDAESLNAMNEATRNEATGSGDNKPRPIPLPQLDNGPHLSYGIQWIAFGILAPIGLAWAIRNEWRERKLEERDRAAAAAPETTESNQLVDRYGRQRTHLGDRSGFGGRGKNKGGERF